MNMTDFPVVNVHVDELSSGRIWQLKLCATFSVNVNLNDRIRTLSLRHIRIEIKIQQTHHLNHGLMYQFVVFFAQIYECQK